MERKAERAEQGLEIWEESVHELREIVKDREGLRIFRDTLGSFGELVQSSMSVGNVFKDAKNEFDNFFSDLGGRMTEGFAAQLGDLVSVFEPVMEKIGVAFGQFFEKLGAGLEDLMGHLFNNVIPSPWVPGETVSFGDQLLQGALTGLLGIPLGFVNFFTYLFTGQGLIL